MNRVLFWTSARPKIFPFKFQRSGRSTGRVEIFSGSQCYFDDSVNRSTRKHTYTNRWENERAVIVVRSIKFGKTQMRTRRYDHYQVSWTITRLMRSLTVWRTTMSLEISGLILWDCVRRMLRAPNLTIARPWQKVEDGVPPEIVFSWRSFVCKASNDDWGAEF